jgi:hypothetical protein
MTETGQEKATEELPIHSSFLPLQPPRLYPIYNTRDDILATRWSGGSELCIGSSEILLPPKAAPTRRDNTRQVSTKHQEWGNRNEEGEH